MPKELILSLLKNNVFLSEQFLAILHWMPKLPCVFATLFVFRSSFWRLSDSLKRPCYDFLLFFITRMHAAHTQRKWECRQIFHKTKKKIHKSRRLYQTIGESPWRHCWYKYDFIVGIGMMSLPVNAQLFGSPKLLITPSLGNITFGLLNNVFRVHDDSKKFGASLTIDHQLR